MSADDKNLPVITDAGARPEAMPFVQHMTELRNRLMYCAVGFLTAFFVCFYFSQDIYGFLVNPLKEAMLARGDENPRMIYTALTEAFFTQVKVAMWAALLISFPIILTQIWKFVAPGLYKNERNAFLPFLVATPVLFIIGALMAYYIVFPMAWKFFVSFETMGGDGVMPIQLEAKVNEYLSLVMGLIFAFGFCFELPVLLTLLNKIGVLSVESLKSGRRYAIVGILIVAAIVTPPDVISQLLLAIPMYLLYEMSIWICIYQEKVSTKSNLPTPV